MPSGYRFSGLWKQLSDSFLAPVEGRLEHFFLKKKNFGSRALAIGFIFVYLFVVGVAVLVVVRTQAQIRAESRLMLRERGALISQLLSDRLEGVLKDENRRSFSHYRYLMTIPGLQGEDVVPSPLSSFPVQSPIPGMIGYFQINPEGEFLTPMIPEAEDPRYPVADRSARFRRLMRLEMIVREFEVGKGTVTERVAIRDLISHQDTTRLMEDDEITEEEQALLEAFRTPRIEAPSEHQSRFFEVESPQELRKKGLGYLNVEIYPFDVKVNGRYMVFHRNVLRANEKYIQGFVVSTPAFFTRIFQKDISYDFMNDVGVRLTTGPYRLLEFGSWEKENEAIRYALAWPFHEVILDVAYFAPRRGEASAAIVLVAFLFLIGFGAVLMLFYRGVINSIQTTQKRGDFISAVTHELKTPLTGITTNIELLSAGFVTREEDRQIIYHRISGETDRLTRLIENVLNISRLERRRLVVKPLLSSIDEVVQRFADQLGSVYQKKGFELRLELTAGETLFYIDPDALMQVLINVVDNAVKFSAGAEIKVVELQTKLTEEGGALLIVRDFGSGVSEGDLKQIFRAFYRSENEMVRSTAGTGIGLSLVKGFCDLMKIKLDALNAHPGLEIRFLIPKRNPKDEEKREAAQEWEG